MESKLITGAEVRELTLEALSESVQQAFLTMVGLEVTVGPLLPEEADRPEGNLVASLVGWVGHWSGNGVLECTPEFACMLTNLLIGSESTELDEEALSCMSEMANIIFGTMKTNMESLLGEMRLSIPTVVYGQSIGMWSPHESFLILPVRIGRHFLRAKMYMICEDEAKNMHAHPWAYHGRGIL